MRLFSESGLSAKVVHLADEKQTIVNLVSAGMGIAIVPRWASRMQVEGVTYVALDTPGADGLKKLPLAVAWTGSTRDPVRDMLVELLRGRIDVYSKDA
jgi:DNA-binding transcriptional LysR family regulator